ncbi:MAG TPA: GNAT family acetyltransferase [Verrucomicrobiales bacterium]|nr:GNAT family acetyltransferase [Verrucomicrobiales bacterium]
MPHSTPSISVQVYDNATQRAQVIALWKTVFGYDSPHNEPSLVIDQKLAVKDDLMFVALAGDKVVGTITAGYDGHRGWLYSLAVLPEHRHGGIGSALVRHAEQALLSRGCLKINLQVVESNSQVVAFYQTLGYAVEPRVSMGKRFKAES